ncbi:MAG: hypothetical protein SGJ19_28145 [Planctomycetia bacterium]|nr:hypothetical protein [Planctomycetia bacterium]
MKTWGTCAFWLALILSAPCALMADEAPANAEPKAAPRKRPEMKAALEQLKHRKSRLALPPAKEGESTVNNGRARAYFLPAEWQTPNTQNAQRSSSGVRGPSDPAMTLDYVFTVELFWIACRINNFHYCLGHQERKLALAGLDDDAIARLDTDWRAFDPQEFAAFGFARKLTLAPHEVTSSDIEGLRDHYSDAEILEMIYHVSRYNGTNRWTDSTGIPQDERAGEEHSVIDTPTSAEFSTRESGVLPDQWVKRPPLESRSDVEAALSQARTREPRVALPDTEQVRQSLPADLADQPLTSWKRAIMQFPTTGSGYIRTYQAMQRVGKIPTLLKAQLAWIAARHDRAWYALDDARRRLTELRVSADQQFALDAPAASDFSPAELAAFAFTEKLTVSPQLISDADVAALQAHYSDFEVAEIIAITCSAATFDRFTESLGLKLED